MFALALAVLNGSAMTLRERRGEIAVLRTVGFSNSQIVAAFMAEGLAIGSVRWIDGIDAGGCDP